MKKAIFKDAKTNIEICHRIEEDPTAYTEHCAQTNHWGKAPRWVRAKAMVPSLPNNPDVLVESYPDEEYTPEDIIGTRTDIPLSGNPVEMVQLRATYTVEVIDLTLDLEYLLEQCYKNRKAAYPSLGDFADAYYHTQNGNNVPMTAWLAAQAAVKVQYPKP